MFFLFEKFFQSFTFAAASVVFGGSAFVGAATVGTVAGGGADTAAVVA
jgi:hypothetical protein